MPTQKRTFVKQLNTSSFEHELFLADYASLVKSMSVDIIKAKLGKKPDKKHKINSLIQNNYGVNKRHANGIIAFVEGAINSAYECKQQHIELLEQKIKTVRKEIKPLEKRIKKHQNYLKKIAEVNKVNKVNKNKRKPKKLPLRYRAEFSHACSINSKKYKQTYFQNAKFKLHNFKRRFNKLCRRVEQLKAKPLHVNIGDTETISFVGSKGETGGNQVCQLQLGCEHIMLIRVPYCLEKAYGQYVKIPIRLSGFGEKEIIQAFAENRAITYRIRQRKLGQWEAHITVDVYVPISTNPVFQGGIGVDINADSVAWCKVNSHGNPTRFNQFKFNLHSAKKGTTEATFASIITELTSLALAWNCPIVVENLDFQAKKSQMRSGSKKKKYNRMLSGFAYNKFYELLASRCFKLGIQHIIVNPAYSSLIGMGKFMSMYGMNSGTAAALVLARRAMRFSEAPPAKTAFAGMEPKKHVWSYWRAINGRVKGSTRHSFYQPKLTVSSSLRNDIGEKPVMNRGKFGSFDAIANKKLKVQASRHLQLIIPGLEWMCETTSGSRPVPRGRRI